MSYEILTFGKTDADTLLLQMVDNHDLEFIENEIALIRELSGGQDFCLKAVRVKSWNHDLSPWTAPAVFGNEDFGDGAAVMLHFLQEKVIPGQETDAETDAGTDAETDAGTDAGIDAETGAGRAPERVFIGGYSLAGLFALWAGCQTDCFDGVAAASPSVWFPQFTEYMQENAIQAEAVYLSLGDREEMTKNPVMSQVGQKIRDAENILKKQGKDCILEWNKGNHFKEPDLRTAKGFSWLMKR